MRALPPFLAAGCGVLLLDYRGYGGNPGRPTEAGLYHDGDAAWQWLHARATRETLPTVLLGKSLGCGVASYLAARYEPDLLILDSPSTSMREVIARHTPWLPPRLLPKLYESTERIGQITCPTLVLHGSDDTLIPVTHAHRLYERLPGPKAMEVIAGAGHNTLTSFPIYQEAIRDFLAGRTSFTVPFAP